MLLMDWVEGETLDRYVRRNINDTYALEMLTYNFSRLAMWLLPQPFAHGDLKPDNILVQADGSLTLVDYDGMYVPAMQGQKARELGSPDFRHPLRTEADFNEHIDDFPAISILLSLRLIAADPSLLDSYGASDRLLFAESDYRDISSCALFKEVFPSHDVDVNTLVSLFTIADMHKSLSHVSFRLLAVRKPQKPEKIEIEETTEEEELSTKVTDEDRANAVKDEFGAMYSKDGKRLLKVPDIKEYKIKEGTKVICDRAFWGYDSLQEISIPESVTAIGDWAFSRCYSLKGIVLPEKLKIIGTNPFIGCRCKISSKSLHFIVKDNVLYNADMSTLISYLSEQTEFAIPAGVTAIGDNAFYECISLKEIYIPAGVTAIGNKAFSRCESLQGISIPTGVTTIGNETFYFCKSLQEISIPASITAIGDEAFYGCKSLQEISIPASVTAIGNEAFSECSSLQEIVLPEKLKIIGTNTFSRSRCKISSKSPHFIVKDNVLYNADMSTLISYLSEQTEFAIPTGVTTIGNRAFSGCTSLQEISIPASVTAIGDKAFYECISLKEIYIPTSVTIIGNETFSRCKALKEIYIPTSVTAIGSAAFSLCNSLQGISIPASVTAIGDYAFGWCESLKEISIPASVTIIGNEAFSRCESLQEISIPTGVTTIGNETFYFCKSLQKISIPANITTIGGQGVLRV